MLLLFVRRVVVVSNGVVIGATSLCRLSLSAPSSVVHSVRVLREALVPRP